MNEKINTVYKVNNRLTKGGNKKKTEKQTIIQVKIIKSRLKKSSFFHCLFVNVSRSTKVTFV